MSREDTNVKKRRVCLAWGLSLVLAVMTLMTAPTQGQQEPLILEEGGYELKPILDAREILPPELLKGKNFAVDIPVSTYGFENTYTITSNFGPFIAYGNDMLRVRIQEIEALAVMAEMKKSKQFIQAAKKAGQSPLKGVGNLILNPVDTVTGIPKGAWRYLSRIGEMVRGGDRRASRDAHRSTRDRVAARRSGP